MSSEVIYVTVAVTVNYDDATSNAGRVTEATVSRGANGFGTSPDRVAEYVAMSLDESGLFPYGVTVRKKALYTGKRTA